LVGKEGLEPTTSRM